MFRTQKAGEVHLLDETEERIEKAVDVEESDRFVVKRELQPGEGLEEFLQGAKASGQRDETRTQVCHHLFAFVHAAHDVQCADTAVAEFFIEQRLRDDADHFSVVGQCSICQRAHQSDIASTIDDSDAGLSEEGTHGAGSGMIDGIIPRTGTTIDTNPA